MHKFNQGDHIQILSSGETAIVVGNDKSEGIEKVECRWKRGEIWEDGWFFENEINFFGDSENGIEKPRKFGSGDTVQIVSTGQSAMVIRYKELLGKNLVECNWWHGDIKESALFSEEELVKTIC